MFCIQIFDTTTEDFSNIIMSVERFDALLELVGPCIAKKYTNFRAPISAEQWLFGMLRYMYFP